MAKITFKNIQCIKGGEINIDKNKLNIKFGYNGFGKTSIAKCIEAHINNQDLAFLTPFSGGMPSITIEDSFTSCIIFNDDFINNYLFIENDIDQTRFDIILHDKESELKFNKIETETNDLKKSIGPSMQKMIEDLSTIKTNLRYKDATAFHGGCGVAKGFKGGADVLGKAKSPDLLNYNDMFSIPTSPDWIKWFLAGKDYINNNKCPYCRHELENDFLNKYDLKITSLFSNVDFAKNNKAKETILKLSEYASNTSRNSIVEINSKKNIEESDVSATKIVFDKIESEISKIQTLQNIDRISLNKKINKKEIENTLNNCFMDSKYFESVNKDLEEEANNINASIKKLMSAIDEYVAALEDFNSFLVKSIEESNKKINDTLKVAGIPYEFSISKDEDNNAIAVIKSLESKEIVTEIKHHLSFGERNAFSMIIFGFLAKKQTHDLIILDDPVSSFDENKKYALMHYLFNKNNGSLKNETCLYLTHDIEPIIDFNFANHNLIKPSISYLYLNKDEVKEKIITKQDLVCSVKHELSQVSSSTEDLFKLIHLRKYCELTADSKLNDMYEVLSNAEKLRNPMTKINGALLDADVQSNGIALIRKYINDFNYDAYIDTYNDLKLISLYESSKVSDIEKLMVARLLVSHHETASRLDDTVFNFVTKQYHIENMFIYAIKDFCSIPKYIFSILDEAVSNIKIMLNNS